MKSKLQADAERRISAILNEFMQASGKAVFAIEIETVSISVTKITDPPGAGSVIAAVLRTHP